MLNIATSYQTVAPLLLNLHGRNIWCKVNGNIRWIAPSTQQPWLLPTLSRKKASLAGDYFLIVGIVIKLTISIK